MVFRGLKLIRIFVICLILNLGFGAFLTFESPVQPPQHVRYDLVDVTEFPTWRNVIINWVLGRIGRDWGYLKLSGISELPMNVPLIYINGSEFPVLWRLECFEYFDGYGWSQTYKRRYEYVSDSRLRNGRIDYTFYVTIVNVEQVDFAGLIPIPTSNKNILTFLGPSGARLYISDSGGFYAFADTSEGNFSFKVAYEIAEYNLTQMALSRWDEIPPNIRYTYTMLPSSFPMVVDEVSNIVKDDDSIFVDELCAVVDFLSNFTCDESVEIEEDADPIKLLLERGEGNSAQISTLAALILRRLGIPTRIVVGFKPRNTSSTGYFIYTGDLHMWVEVYFPKTGWVPIDPSIKNATLDVPSIEDLKSELSTIEMQVEREKNVVSAGNVSVGASGNVSAGNVSVGASGNVSSSFAVLFLIISLPFILFALAYGWGRSRSEPLLEPPTAPAESVVPEYLGFLMDNVVKYYDSKEYRGGVIHVGRVLQRLLGDLFGLKREEWETFREYVQRVLESIGKSEELGDVLNRFFVFTFLYEKALYSSEHLGKDDFLIVIDCLSSILDYLSGIISREVVSPA